MTSIRSLVLGTLGVWLAACSSTAGSDGGTGPAACAGVVCTASDACHVAGACDSSTGTCSNPKAQDGQSCPGGSCAAGVCIALTASTCGNGLKDAAEADVDCGGTCLACVNGKACDSGTDCMSGACVAGRCAAAVDALVADPGPGLTVDPGANVRLDGSRSRSPLGAIVTWSWTQTAGPAVAITGADTARPRFQAPAVGSLAIAFSITVGDGAATANASVEVQVRARAGAPAKTSIAKIRKAMTEGALDRETAAMYLAFAVFGDSRLPAEWAGDPERSGTGAMEIVSAEFPTLSPEAQEVLRPFLVPFPQPAASGPSRVLRRMAVTAPDLGWHSADGAEVRVWYDPAVAGQQALAEGLRDEVDRWIWSRLLTLWTTAHMPMNDAGEAQNGGDGRLDIILEPMAGAYGVAERYMGRDPPSPVFIRILSTLPLVGSTGAGGVIETAAHEMTHGCQSSHKRFESYASATWIYEGTATWGEDFVYPDTNTEHEYAQEAFDNVRLSLDDPSGNLAYGSYMLFQWAARTGGDDFVRRAIDNVQREKALAAVDHAFPNGFGLEWQWRGFVESRWNRDPAQGFWAVDQLAIGATPEGGTSQELRLAGPELEHAFELEARVDHLSARYHHFTLPDPSARVIFFYDGLTYPLVEQVTDIGTFLLFDPTVLPDPMRFIDSVALVLGKRGTAWTRQDAAMNSLLVCQDDPDSRLDELVVAFGDGKPEKAHFLEPLGLKPRIWVSNVGCYRWQGSVSAQKSPSYAGPDEELSVTDVVWERDPTFDTAGQLGFHATQGTVTWSISGTYDGCTYEGSETWGVGPYSKLAFFPQFTGGPAHRGYGGAGQEQDVSYLVTCPDGSGGTTTSTQKKPVSWFQTGRLADPNWFPQVSASGVVASESADDGQMVYSWTFTSTPAP